MHVVGLWMMDGYTYPTLKARRLRFRRELKGRLSTAIASWSVRRLRRLSAAVAHFLGRNDDSDPKAATDTFRGHRLVDAVRCDFAPHIDHTITSIAVQDQLISAICAWATGRRVAAR
jgi:hypothetical protein